MTASRLKFPTILLLALSAAWPEVFFSTAAAQSLDAPVQGFLSIEPYEVRQTFVVRLDALGIITDGKISASEHRSVLNKVLEQLSGKSPITLDGSLVALEHERSEFIRSDPDLTIVTDDRELIPADEAMVAVVFAASRPGFPDTASITWDLFPEGVESVEVTFRSPSDKKKFIASPAEPIVTWKVPETAASLPRLEKLPPLIPLPRLSVPLLTIVLGLAAIVIVLLSRRLGERTPPAFALLALCATIGAFACWKTGRLNVVHPFQKPAAVTPEQADEITYALLLNLYHSFDYREREQIYDTLANSAHGPLLERIYLEISKSLTLEDQGGAKVRIKNIDLRRCVPTPLAEAEDPRAFVADCEWVAIGDVTHWAHTHTRLNRYSAELTIAPVDGQWKMTNLQILEEFSEVQKREDNSGQK